MIVPTMLLAFAAATAPTDEPYLPPAAMADGVRILPPPPAPGGARAGADRAIFQATRRLRGSARWRLAAEDIGNAPLDRYACALGMRLTPASAPALAHLLDKAGTGDLVGPVKARYAARRPYLGTRAPICQPKTKALARNGDYPSGHAANGWLEGLILAELMPDRATSILARARAYGESRAVCGAHSASAVEAGWLAGSTTFALLQSSPLFRRDLAVAAEELERIAPIAGKPDAARCAAEAAALAARPY